MQERNDEIEALGAIFGDEFRLTNRETLEISINLDEKYQIKLSCYLPEDYPAVLAEPDLEGQCLTEVSKAALKAQLESIALHDAGSVVVFKWVDWLRDSALDFLHRNGHLDGQRNEIGTGHSAQETNMNNDLTLNNTENSATAPLLDTDTVSSNEFRASVQLLDWVRESEPFQTWNSWSAFDQQNGMRCGVWGELDGDGCGFVTIQSQKMTIFLLQSVIRFEVLRYRLPWGAIRNSANLPTCSA